MKGSAWYWVGFVTVALVLSSVDIVLAVMAPAAPEKVHTPRSQYGTTPPSCGHLYNVDKSREWAHCVGVPIVPRVQLKRDDI